MSCNYSRSQTAHLLILALAFAYAGILPYPAHADTPKSWGQVGFLNQFETALDGGGNFELDGGFVHGQFVVRLVDDVHVRMLGSYHGADYDFNPPPTIAGSSFKPWNVVHIVRLNPLLGYELNDKINLFAGPLVEASFENGADLSASLKPGGLIGAEMQINADLKVGLGLVGVAEIEGDFYLQPVLLLDWTPMDGLTIHASSWTTRGGRFEIAYAFTDEFEIATSVTYQRERFRLQEHTLTIEPPPPTFRIGSKGIGVDRAVIPALRISYSPKSQFIEQMIGALRIDLDVGVALAGSLRMESSTGGSIQTIGYDPAPTIGVNVSVPL